MTSASIGRGTASQKRWLAGGIALLLALGLAMGVLAPAGSNASSHREAPLISADPQVDGTDVYAFVSPDDPTKVTFISNWIPNEEPAGGPNFYRFATKARYDVKIDNDGDAKPDLVYRWKFKNHYRSKDTILYNTGPVTSLTDENLNFYQTYDLKKVVPGRKTKTLANDRIVVPSYVGDASMPDYGALRDEGTYSFATATSKVFAGQANDPFFIDLRVFDLLYGGDFSEVGDDTLKGFNVNTLALQVPITAVARGKNPVDNPVIGTWSTTARRRLRVERDGNQSFKGKYAQVSRLGNPLVNELVIALRDKDRWNASAPKEDGQFLKYVKEPELPELIEAIYGIPAPDTCPPNEPDSAGDPPRCRTDLIDVFLRGVKDLNRPPGVTPSEQMRLNLTTPPCEAPTCPEHSDLGVIGGDLAGYPNGRRLADDAIDITLRVVEGILLPEHDPAAETLGDGVNNDDAGFGNTFPYVGLPASGSDPQPHQD